jgi:hypothetical protein
VFWGDDGIDYTTHNSPELTSLEQELGVEALPYTAFFSGTELCAFTFEEFLAREYFGTWARTLLHSSDGRPRQISISGNHDGQENIPQLPQKVMTFLINLYTESGRASRRNDTLMRSLY